MAKARYKYIELTYAGMGGTRNVMSRTVSDCRQILNENEAASPPDSQARDGEPTDQERLEMAGEVLLGAKWLLVLGLEAVEGSSALQSEAQQIRRGLDLVSAVSARFTVPDPPRGKTANAQKR
jgi:hypothetical protein